MKEEGYPMPTYLTTIKTRLNTLTVKKKSTKNICHFALAR